MTKTITFRVKANTAFGEGVLVVGASTALGSWNPSLAVPLSYDKDFLWTAAVALKEDVSSLEFKFVLRDLAGSFRSFHSPQPFNTYLK